MPLIVLKLYFEWKHIFFFDIPDIRLSNRRGLIGVANFYLKNIKNYLITRCLFVLLFQFLGLLFLEILNYVIFNALDNNEIIACFIAM